MFGQVAPTVSHPIADQTVLEDASNTTIDLSSVFTDVDNDDSSISKAVQANTNTGLVSATISGNVLTLDYHADQNGSATITIRATSNGETVDDVFVVTVTAVNDEPSFTKGSDKTVLEDSGTSTTTNWATSISTGPSNESGQTPTFSVTNNNNSLFSGQPAISSSGVLTFTPASNANGSATVTISLSDDGGTSNGGDDTYANQTFTITVTAVNDIPVINAVSDPTAILEDAGSQTINLAGIGDGDADVTQSLTVTATSSNTSLIPNPTVTYTSDNAIGSLAYTPVSDINGTAVITVTVTDNGGTANSGVNAKSITFTVTVTAVNDEPSFTKGSDKTVLEDSGTSTTTNWATSISTGPSNESGQTPTFSVTNNNNSLFSGQPAISSSGVLTFTPASNANGSATVTISLSDDGGTSNGGDDTYANQTFSITVIGYGGCTDPFACNYDESATADDGSCIYPDENYDCFGNCTVEVDCFNNCGGTATEDCAGTCGGGAEIDECGVCGGSGPSGCDDICGSTAVVDNCGTCDEDPSNDCPMDCAGEWGGTAIIDSCEDCTGGNTGLEPDYNDPDDDGVCNFGSANGEEDNCPNTPTENEDQADNDNDSGNGVDDGDDTTGGDACDTDDDNDFCIDAEDPLPFDFSPDLDFNGYGNDCDPDDDNDGCLDEVDDNPWVWSPDNDGDGLAADCDPEPDCATNDIDDCGVCGGDGSSCTNEEATLSFGGIDLASQTIAIHLENSAPVSGFQFLLSSDDSVDFVDVYGGSSEENGFTVDIGGNNIVLGFSLSTTEIPTGSDVLTIVEFDGFTSNEICLSEGVITSGYEDAQYLDVSYGDCISLYSKGDVNMDGVLDVLDIVTIVSIIFETIDPDDYQLWAADYNSDGDINIMDIVQIVNAIFADDAIVSPSIDLQMSDELLLTISVNNFPEPVSIIGFEVIYNPEAISYSNFTSGDYAVTWTSGTSFLIVDNIFNDGELLTMYFQGSEDSYQYTTIYLNNIIMYDNNGIELIWEDFSSSGVCYIDRHPTNGEEFGEFTWRNDYCFPPNYEP